MRIKIDALDYSNFDKAYKQLSSVSTALMNLFDNMSGGDFALFATLLEDDKLHDMADEWDSAVGDLQQLTQRMMAYVERKEKEFLGSN